MTKPKRARRSYTDEQKAAALATLAAESGNLRRAARIAGVPYSSLKGWRNAPMPVSPELLEEATEKLDILLEQIAGKLATGLNRSETLSKLLTRPAQAGVLLGITVDKIVALRNKVPNEAKLTLSEFLSQAKWIEEAVEVRADRPTQRSSSARSSAPAERQN